MFNGLSYILCGQVANLIPWGWAWAILYLLGSFLGVILAFKSFWETRKFDNYGPLMEEEEDPRNTKDNKA